MLSGSFTGRNFNRDENKLSNQILYVNLKWVLKTGTGLTDPALGKALKTSETSFSQSLSNKTSASVIVTKRSSAVRNAFKILFTLPILSFSIISSSMYFSSCN
ncbi:hypothetical protein D3C86_1812400 [compost metagenome]